ncbi:MAG: hypothetical protein Q4A07_02020 [Coriobacteriales bacterium]|nr:hypothetical protein [Coriobacteriales bacterium]
MISVYPPSETPKLVRKYTNLGEDVFITARDFFHRNKDIRHHKVVVYNGDKVACCLGFQKNKPVNWEDAEANPMVQMHLSNFWEYSADDEGLDYSYVDRFALFVYSELEEYSYHTARIIRRHNPSATIAFLDKNARLFFGEGDGVLVAESEEALFAARPELKDLRTLRVHPEIRWNVQGVFTNDVPSYLVMTSLYWVRREFYYGPLNPNKTFYLIKQPVKENGLTALINNVIGTKQMIRALRPDFIPVVDLGIAGDPNQFAGTSGEDVWSMFFEQLSDHTLAEVYNSQHVVLDQSSNLNMNPRFTEFVFSNQRAELNYGDDLQYNEAVRTHTDAVLGKVFPAEAGRVLAVVVRGTDYNAARVANYVPHGLTAEETLAKAAEYVREGNFDHVYLCTEDASYLDLFLKSELADKLIYVDQERIDYGREENDEKLLLEIFARDRSNPYARTLDYIAVLEGLTKCQALLANVSCGAVTYALNRGTNYEFVDVGQIQSGLNG